MFPEFVPFLGLFSAERKKVQLEKLHAKGLAPESEVAIAESDWDAATRATLIGIVLIAIGIAAWILRH